MIFDTNDNGMVFVQCVYDNGGLIRRIVQISKYNPPSYIDRASRLKYNNIKCINNIKCVNNILNNIFFDNKHYQYVFVYEL